MVELRLCEIRRGLAQDFIGLTQSPNFAFKLVGAALLLRLGACAQTTILLSLVNLIS